MTADNAIELALMVLRPVYKQALAHSAGRDNNITLGLDKVIKELESILTIGKSQLSTTNMTWGL